MKKQIVLATLLTAFCANVFAAPAPKAVTELTPEQKAQVEEIVKSEQSHRQNFTEQMNKLTQEQRMAVHKQLWENFRKDHKDFKNHKDFNGHKFDKKHFKKMHKFQKGCCCCHPHMNGFHPQHNHRHQPPAPPVAAPETAD